MERKLPVCYYVKFLFFFFLRQELLLDFAAWIVLNLNTDNSTASALETSEHALFL